MSITKQIEDLHIADDGLCDHCKNLSFGTYYIGNETSDISIQYQRVDDLMSSSCPLCITRSEMRREWIYRCISTGPSVRNCAKGLSAPTSVLKLIYFKVEYIDELRQVTTFIRNSGVLTDELAVESGNDASLEEADLDLAKIWLEHCDKEHNITCAKPHCLTIPFFKVINCSNGRICEVSGAEPYAALSYVWGASTDDGSTDDKRLQVFKGNHVDFPRTIKDAMSVTARLGLEYLWVDRYCIDQSNDEQRHSLISNMHRIYSGAHVTIIAASGMDPHHGLPGVSGTPRSAYRLDYLVGLKDASWELEECTWSTRGWTYQEMLLSRRRLIFTDSQMILQCCSRTFYEILGLPSRYHPEQDEKHVASPVLNAPLLGCTEDMMNFQSPLDICPDLTTQAIDIWDLIQEYSGRHLSYPKDNLDAFEGIFDTYARETGAYTHHFWGIPIEVNTRSALVKHRSAVSSFVYGLAWIALLEDADERHAAKWREWWRPSWSWVDVMGHRITYDGHSLGRADDVAQNQESIWVTLIHQTGRREELWRYAQGRLDQFRYYPMIELSSWLLEDGRLVYNYDEKRFTFLHRSFDDESTKILAWPDSRRTRYRDKILAIYLGTTSFTFDQKNDTTPRQYFLFAERETDASLRRVGLGWCYVPDTCLDYGDETRLRWLPGPDPGYSYNAWKHGTVVLE